MRHLSYLRRNKHLAAGLVVLLCLVLFAGVGSVVVDTDLAYPLSVTPRQPPSLAHPFGTDQHGRDLLAATIRGTYLTSRIGITAGLIGLGVGVVLGFLSAYYGGALDAIIRWIVDVLLTVPGFLVLVVIATTVAPLQSGMSVDGMALVVALLAWLWPTRTIRSQVLTLRERAFVRVAKLSGMGDLEIIFRELMPNLLPYLGASLVNSVTGAIGASLGLEALGLGPAREPTLGMTIYWATFHIALVRGMWWWVMCPVAIILLIFVTLYLISSGLDELANPRLRSKV